MNTKLLLAIALLGTMINSNSEAMMSWKQRHSNLAPMTSQGKNAQIEKTPVEEATEYVNERIRDAQIKIVALETALVNFVQSDDKLRTSLVVNNSSPIPDVMLRIQGIIKSYDSEVIHYRDVLNRITENDGKEYLKKLDEVQEETLFYNTNAERIRLNMPHAIARMYGEAHTHAHIFRGDIIKLLRYKLKGIEIDGVNTVKELNEGGREYKKLYEMSPLKPTN